jgi:hypothetical protein
MLLLEGAGAAPEVAAAIASEAGGHPLFIDELVRHSFQSTPATAGPLRLDDALWERSRRLDDEALRALEVAAVAGTPLLQETAAQACDLSFALFAEAVGRLRAQNLVRTTGARRTDLVEPYHDRVREAVLGRLPAEQRRELHRRIATALEASERSDRGPADPEALATHWQGAGDATPAGFAAAAAAGRAAAALALDRAAELYKLALELRPSDGPAELELVVKMAHALGSAGRGADAARAYQRGAALAGTEQAAELGARAAQQLLISGHIDAGLEAVRDVLEQGGLSMPRAGFWSLIALGGRRAQLRLRGLRWKGRAAADIPPETLLRLDVCWSVATALSMADALRGSYFATRHALLALGAGEPVWICLTLALEAAFSAMPGVRARKRTAALVARADELASRLGKPHPAGAAALGRGVAAYLEGRFRNALAAATEAERTFRDGCKDVAWEVDSSVLFGLWARYYLGEIEELSRLVPLRLREATGRGDLYVSTYLQTGLFNAVHLFRDDPESARRAAENAMARWSHQGFHIQHHHDFVARSQLALYEGAGPELHARARAHVPRLEQSLLWQVQIVRIEAVYILGRAAVACAAAEAPGSPARKAFCGDARKSARRLMGESGAWAAPLGALVDAAALSLGGDRAGALARLVLAAAGADELDLTLFAIVARRARGLLLGGDEGQALVEEADRAMEARQIRAPARVAAMLAPGF